MFACFGGCLGSVMVWFGLFTWSQGVFNGVLTAYNGRRNTCVIMIPECFNSFCVLVKPQLQGNERNAGHDGRLKQKTNRNEMLAVGKNAKDTCPLDRNRAGDLSVSINSFTAERDSQLHHKGLSNLLAPKAGSGAYHAPPSTISNCKYR